MSPLPSTGRSAPRFAVLFCVFCILLQSARADTFYWGGPSNSGTNPPAGGTAVWATNTTRWTLMNYEGVGAAGYFLWANGNTAVFGGTAGTVNLGNSYTLADFNVITGGYIFEIGATRTLTLTSFGGDGLASTTWRPTTNASRTLVLEVAGSTELSGLLTDATNGTSLLGLTKQGAGTLTLPNANLLTGGTTVSAGVLRAGHNNALGFGGVTIGAGGTLEAVGQALDLANPVSVGGSSASPSIIAGSENITVVGKTTGAAGASRGLQNNIGAGKSLTLGDVDISPDTNNPRTLFLSGTGDLLISGTIANGNAETNNSISLAVSGTVTLASSNTYTGTTTLTTNNTGAVRLGHNSALGSGSVTFNAGILEAFGGPRTLANSFLIGGNVTFGGTNALTISGPVTLNSTREMTNNNPGGLTLGEVFIGNTDASRSLILQGSNNTTFAGPIADSAATNVGSLDVRSTGLTVLNASNSYSGNTIIRGSVDLTNIPGSTVRLGHPFALGAPGGTNTVNSGGQLDLHGQSVAGEDLRILGSGFQEAGALVNSAAGPANWSGPVALLGATTVAVTNGNISIAGPVTGTSANFVLTKTGAGTLSLGGSNTYIANTVVSAGRLELATSGSLLFVVSGNGVNNSVSGAGSASFHGAFDLDLSSAGTNPGDSWTLVSVDNSAYGTNFIVSGFSTSGDGLWTRETNSVTYQFSQATGVLSLAGAPPANVYSNWLTNYPTLTGTNTSPSADPDGDSYDNAAEFAFDGNPTVGSPAFLRAVKSGTNVLISYVGRSDSVTNYHVLSTTNLATGPWLTNTSVTVTNSADQSGILLPTEYVRREFSVPGTNRDFFRIQAAFTLP